MFAAPGSAQEQHLYLNSETRRVRRCLFCPPLRKYTSLFFIFQKLTKYFNVRAVGLFSKMFIKAKCLSCLFLSKSISFLLEFKQTFVYVCLFVSSQYQKFVQYLLCLFFSVQRFWETLMMSAPSASSQRTWRQYYVLWSFRNIIYIFSL